MAAERFKNAKTWKQISTNVPHEMYRRLHSKVTKDITMSQLLRDLISESALMRYDNLPRPCWSVELTQHVAALRDELSAEKQVRADVEKTLSELRAEIAELRKDRISQPDIAQPFEKQSSEEAQTQTDESEPQKQKWPIIGRLVETFAGTRKTA